MTNTFEGWVASQGQNPNIDQGRERELEYKQRHDWDLLSNANEKRELVDIMKEVQKSKLLEFIDQDGG